MKKNIFGAIALTAIFSLTFFAISASAHNDDNDAVGNFNFKDKSNGEQNCIPVLSNKTQSNEKHGTDITLEEIELVVEKMEVVCRNSRLGDNAGFLIRGVTGEELKSLINDGDDACVLTASVSKNKLNGDEIWGRKIVVNKIASNVEDIQLAVEKTESVFADSRPGDNVGFLIRGLSKEELKKLIGDGDNVCKNTAKAVKEVMDVYDKMDLKNLTVGESLGYWISGVTKDQNGDDIVLRKRPGRSESSKWRKGGSIILLGDDSQREW